MELDDGGARRGEGESTSVAPTPSTMPAVAAATREALIWMDAKPSVERRC